MLKNENKQCVVNKKKFVEKSFGKTLLIKFVNKKYLVTRVVNKIVDKSCLHNLFVEVLNKHR